MKLIRVSPECCDKCLSKCLEFRLKIEGCAIRGYDIDFNITQVCTEYHKNETKITPPVPRKAVITKMPAIPEVEEQITPVVTKIGPYAIKKTGVQKLIVNPKWSLTRVEMGVQGVLRHNCGCNQRLPQLSGKVEKEYSLLKFAKLSGIMPLIWRGNFSPAKPVGEGDLDSQPTFRMGPLEDAEAKPVGEGDLDSQPTFRMGPLGDAEVMDQKSVQKEELPGGSSGSVAASAAERKEMADTNTVTDADKARAAKPVGEGDLDSQPTFRMGPLGDAEAKPMREGDLDSQPTFRMEVLVDAEESLVLQLFPEFECSFYLHIRTLSGEWEQRYRLISSLSGVVLLSTRFIRECLYPMGKVIYDH
ncbi:hypothetical protein DUI87_34166 [Hirundo rustica rustica]|uniref:Uncharacterized protein n=1 Tax=Hirundo rustica rustica TaxID=333673 RepID=A0A3M0IKY8_HIRRU|nr:hypothetical protein DUI87_34166 [Hirundo rustica rustica]